eukprot:TRINITY_DN1177_c0_g1_i2.p1 TRINITY_DN1177_c0_g1~~TRINITY_DN1177_c0_g1_i2.p1  ORF type:complete len:376 (+),score=39.12 TRINITY_DN1177_c0_g1_i2:264-1391(+)
MSSAEGKDPSNVQQEIGSVDAFQRRVADRLQALIEEKVAEEQEGESILSLSWLRLAIAAVLDSEEDFHEFRVFTNPRASIGRAVADFMDRGLKALDICNAVRDGIEQIRLWQKHIEIILSALDVGQKSLAEANFRRAKKTLIDLALSMSTDDKEFISSPNLAARNRSFARAPQSSASSFSSTSSSSSHSRSLSWSVSRTWSAGKQLQAMTSNLTPPPKGSEAVALALYTMSNLILFSAWILVAAIPCQDRAVQINFGAPKSLPWAPPLLSIHERVMEESKKRDRRGSAGLLREICYISISVRRLLDLIDASPVSFPLNEKTEQEVRKEVAELKRQWSSLKEGLEPFERQVRELFLRIVSARTEVLDSTNRHVSND